MISMKFSRFFWSVGLSACMGVGAGFARPAWAAELSTDARGAIPYDVQQLIAVDYRAMQNSPAAMDLKARILPPELKQLEQALKNSGLNANQDVDQLAFASFRVKGVQGTRIVGIAQGQFSVADIRANWKKKNIRPTLIRTNRVYPMGASGMMVTFLDQTTMVFGTMEAVKSALDARDGLSANVLTNGPIMDSVLAVESQPVWSVLDQQGTQFMMRSVLGQAAQVADYDTVKKRLLSSRYTMNFNNGIKFDLDLVTPDAFTAGTMASVLNAAALYEKMNGTASEKQAIDNTKISSSASRVQVDFSASDSQFASLLQSPLFQSVVH